jgi:uncharacterized membrane protein SirB2
LSELFTSGRIVDLVLAFTLIEAAALIVWHRRTGRGLPPASVVVLLLPGICLMLALRAALTDASWPWLALLLLASLAAHLADLVRRWRR